MREEGVELSDLGRGLEPVVDVGVGMISEDSQAVAHDAVRGYATSEPVPSEGLPGAPDPRHDEQVMRSRQWGQVHWMQSSSAPGKEGDRV